MESRRERQTQEVRGQTPTTCHPREREKINGRVYLTENWSTGPLVQTWTVAQIWEGCFRPPPETTGPELVLQKKPPNTKGKKKKKLNGDCTASFDPNTNGENQKSGSTETARPVFVTQPEGKTINPRPSMAEGRGERGHVVNEIGYRVIPSAIALSATNATRPNL